MSRGARGFTLLEVLVAIAILGLGLTVILSSQAGLFSSAKRGQHLTVATSLLRCKMSEVELELLKTGYQELDQTGDGSCCGDEGELGYHCAWKVERIELPEPSDMMDGGLSSDGGLGALEALSQLTQPKAGGGSPLGGGPESLQQLAEGLGESSAASGIGPMVMGMVYPQIKPLFEASIRKLTVKVEWKEGITPRELTVSQYVTDPQQGGFDGDAGVALDGGGMPSGLSGLLGGMGQQKQ